MIKEKNLPLDSLSMFLEIASCNESCDSASNSSHHAVDLPVHSNSIKTLQPTSYSNLLAQIFLRKSKALDHDAWHNK